MLDDLKTANVEVLEQLLSILNSLSDELYRSSYMDDGSSAIGRHVRHIIDLYRALMTMDEADVIDFDKRNRGSLIEQDKSAAGNEVMQVLGWILALDNQANKQVMLKTEVSVYQTRQIMLETNVFRELCYVASHTTHHLALLTLLARSRGIVIDKAIGVAPTTATYCRSLQ